VTSPSDSAIIPLCLANVTLGMMIPSLGNVDAISTINDIEFGGFDERNSLSFTSCWNHAVDWIAPIDDVYHYDYDRNGNVIWKNSTLVNWKCIYNSFGQMTQVLNNTFSGGA
jgi:hypothetical protein